MASSTSKIMSLVFILSLVLPNILATEYVVCGDLGWTVGASVSEWLSSLPPIVVGDIFYFSYQFPTTVAVVDETGYLTCNATEAATNDVSGSFSYTFNETGTYWFISAAPADCAAGLEMEVVVV